MDSTDNAVQVITQRICDLQILPSYSVANAHEAQHANSALGTIKALAKELDAIKDAELRPLLEATKAVRDKYRPAEDLLAQAERVLKAALVEFQRKEAERIAAERIAAERAAAEERARLEEAARREREKAAARAAELQAAGKIERAEAVLQAAEASAAAKESVAAMVAATPPVSAPTALKGLSTRERWTGRVVNERQFLASLLQHTEIDVNEIVSFKQAGLNRLAGLYKTAAQTALPGLSATCEHVAAARANA